MANFLLLTFVVDLWIQQISPSFIINFEYIVLKAKKFASESEEFGIKKWVLYADREHLTEYGERNKKNAVFRYMAPCRFCVKRRSSETSVDTIPTQRHIPEDGILHSHRRENLKTYNVIRTLKWHGRKTPIECYKMTTWEKQAVGK
jgi:hypothetical protein